MKSRLWPTLFVLVCVVVISTEVQGANGANDGGGGVDSMMTMMSNMYASGKMTAAELGNVLLKLLYLLQHLQPQKPGTVKPEVEPVEPGVTTPMAPGGSSVAGNETSRNNETDSGLPSVAGNMSLTVENGPPPGTTTSAQPRRMVFSPMAVDAPIDSSLPVMSSIIQPSSQAAMEISTSLMSTPELIDPSSTILETVSSEISLVIELVSNSPVQSVVVTPEISSSPVLENVIPTPSVELGGPREPAVELEKQPTTDKNPPLGLVVNPPSQLAATSTTAPQKSTIEDPVVGQNGEWGSWGSCSPPCGGCGTRTRIRDCTVTGCSLSKQKSDCGFYPCPSRIVSTQYYCYKPVACPSYKYPGSIRSPYPNDPYRRDKPNERRQIYEQQRNPYQQTPEYGQPRSRVTPGYAFQGQRQPASRVYRKKRQTYREQQYPTQGPSQVGTYNINIQSGVVYDGGVRSSQRPPYRQQNSYAGRTPANSYRNPAQSSPDYSYYNRDPRPSSPPVVVKPPHSDRYLEPQKTPRISEPYPKPSYPEPQPDRVPYGGDPSKVFQVRDPYTGNYDTPKDAPRPPSRYPDQAGNKPTGYPDGGSAYPGDKNPRVSSNRYPGPYPKPSYPETQPDRVPYGGDPNKGFQVKETYSGNNGPPKDVPQPPSGYPDPTRNKPTGYPDGRSAYPGDKNPRVSSNRYPSGGHPKPYDETYKKTDPIYRTRTGECVSYTMCQTQYDSGKYCCQGRNIRGGWCVPDQPNSRYQRNNAASDRPYQ